MIDIRSKGIYKIVNQVNGKIYIGSTNNFYKRKANHFSRLRANAHSNAHLQASFNKYSQQEFIFTPIEEVKDINKLIERERYWVFLYNALDKSRGYNLAFPEEDGSWRRRKVDEVINKKSKWENYKVYQLDKHTGEIITTFNSLADAARKMGYKDSRKLQRCVYGKQPSYKGHVYVYVKDYDDTVEYAVISNQSGLKRSKSIVLLNENMIEYKRYGTILDASNDLGINRSAIYFYLKKGNLYQGYFWKYS